MDILAGPCPTWSVNALVYRPGLVQGRHYEQAATEKIQRLELFGCNIDSRNRFGNTPPHKAVCSLLERGDLYVLRGLLIAGADRNVQNQDGDTAIHLIMIDRPIKEGIANMPVRDDLAFLDQALNLELQGSDGRSPATVSAIVSVGGVWWRLLSLTVASITDCARYGKMVLDLWNIGIEGKINYIRDEARHCQEIGLGVSVALDCG